MNKRTEMYLRWGIPLKHRARSIATDAVYAFGRRMDWWLEQMLIKLDLDNRHNDAETDIIFILDDDGSFQWRDNNEENN